jgi:hypothetical protein
MNILFLRQRTSTEKVEWSLSSLANGVVDPEHPIVKVPFSILGAY